MSIQYTVPELTNFGTWESPPITTRPRLRPGMFLFRSTFVQCSFERKSWHLPFHATKVIPICLISIIQRPGEYFVPIFPLELFLLRVKVVLLLLFWENKSAEDILNWLMAYLIHRYVNAVNQQKTRLIDTWSTRY